MNQPIVELEIERMAYGPAAIARKEGLVYMVRGGVPGDTVRAKVTAQKRNYCEASVIEVLSPSKYRVTPKCAYFESCGGCQWQHLSYEAQIEAKTQILLRAIATATIKLEFEINSVLQIHRAQNQFEYRTRLQARGEGDLLGFYAEKSHRLIPIQRCIVAHPLIQKAWSENKFRSDRPYKIEWTVTNSGELKSAINEKHGSLGFSQVNAEQNKVLVDVVTLLAQKNATSGKLVLDLYGGDGNLVNGLTDDFETIRSVDVNSGDPSNKKIDFINDSVDQYLAQNRDQLKDQVDVIIADPPRSGLETVADQLLEIKPDTIILVSCDPQTLSRDIKKLTGNRFYSVIEVHLVDMFPQTFHIESVVLLKRQPRSSLDELRKLK